MRQAGFVASSSFLLALLVSSAWAQANRTFVSAQRGNDGNVSSICAPTTPCRTFAAAIGVTNPGGEIIVLDSGGYGPVAIGTSIKIEAPDGVYAGITAPSGTGISVSAGPSDVVVLRGLTLNGVGTGVIAIGYTSAAKLQIENCVMDGFTSAGVITVGDTGGKYLSVQNCVIRNSFQGVAAGTNSGSIVASIDHCKVESCSFAGFTAGNNTKMMIRDTVVQDIFSWGFLAQSGGAILGAVSELDLENCQCFNSGSSIGARSSGTNPGTVTVRVSSTRLTGNATGIEIDNLNGGTVSVISHGNNRLAGNQVDGSFTSNIGQQ